MDGIVARHVFKDLFSYFIYCLLAYIFKFGCLIIAINFLGCVVNRFFTNAAGFLISAVMILTAPDALALSACQAWYAGADKNNYGDPRSACLAWLPFADFGRGLKFLRADLAYPGEPDRGAKCMVTGPNGGVEWAEYNAAIRNLDCPILPPDPPCLTCPCPNDGPAEGLATPNPIVPAVAEKIRIDTDGNL